MASAQTVSTVFHLHNKSASREMKVLLDGTRIRHDHRPIYLGVTLDRSLTFHDQLKKVAAKASQEEINNAFRSLSRIYHPDKHMEIEKKENAEILFTKIKKAHEVLADPQKRAIYDTTGIKGLEMQGWQIVSRTKTPQEILEEFELLQQERELQKLQQLTNPEGKVVVGVDATDLFDRYEILDSDQLLPHMEISEMSLSQSVECPLTTTDTATITGLLSSRNGTGSGTISVALRRTLSQTGWAELEMAVGNGLNCGLKGFRTLWRRGYGTAFFNLHFTPQGFIKPSYNAMVAHQLDTNLQGRLSWNGGATSNLNAMLIWNKTRHHCALGFQLGIPSCFAFAQYTHRFIKHNAKIKGMIRIGTFGAMLEYGCEKKITKFSDLGASVTVGVPVGVSVKIRLNRGSQTFEFPVHLSESLSPSAIFYGTFVPLAAYFCVKKLIVEPYLQQQKEKDLLKKKEANSKRMAEKKKEAAAAIELMRETVKRSCEIEENKGGLIIRKAFFGKQESEVEYIDVTCPLQTLVRDSKVILPCGTVLVELPGFYDPCVGEDKVLTVSYEFQRQLHFCRFQESDKILIPSANHQIGQNQFSTTNENQAS